MLARGRTTPCALPSRSSSLSGQPALAHITARTHAPTCEKTLALICSKRTNHARAPRAVVVARNVATKAYHLQYPPYRRTPLDWHVPACPPAAVTPPTHCPLPATAAARYLRDASMTSTARRTARGICCSTKPHTIPLTRCLHHPFPTHLPAPRCACLLTWDYTLLNYTVSIGAVSTLPFLYIPCWYGTATNISGQFANAALYNRATTHYLVISAVAGTGMLSRRRHINLHASDSPSPSRRCNPVSQQHHPPHRYSTPLGARRQHCCWTHMKQTRALDSVPHRAAPSPPPPFHLANLHLRAMAAISAGDGLRRGAPCAIHPLLLPSIELFFLHFSLWQFLCYLIPPGHAGGKRVVSTTLRLFTTTIGWRGRRGGPCLTLLTPLPTLHKPYRSRGNSRAARCTPGGVATAPPPSTRGAPFLYLPLARYCCKAAWLTNHTLTTLRYTLPIIIVPQHTLPVVTQTSVAWAGTSPTLACRQPTAARAADALFLRCPPCRLDGYPLAAFRRAALATPLPENAPLFCALAGGTSRRTVAAAE